MKPPAGRDAAREIDDEMMKDPVCNVYFPKREGLHLHVNGQDLYFCSDACREKFIESGDVKHPDKET